MRRAVRTLELERGSTRFELDRGLSFEPLPMRNLGMVARAVRGFRPDFIHVTGPGDFGAGGRGCAAVGRAACRGLAHESRRVRRAAFRMGAGVSSRGLGARSAWAVEWATLKIAAGSYGLARVCLAPNPELIDLVRRATGRPTHPMPRGVGT